MYKIKIQNLQTFLKKKNSYLKFINSNYSTDTFKLNIFF